MITIQRVLLPTDFSDTANEAQVYAVALAAQFQAELHVLTVVQDIAYISPEINAPAIVPMNIEEVRQSAAEALLQVPGPAAPALPLVYREVRVGSPEAEILAYASEHKIDVIVLGTHGRTGLAHVLMGSTAEDLVRKAPCPVLTVKLSGRQFATVDTEKGPA